MGCDDVEGNAATKVSMWSGKSKGVADEMIPRFYTTEVRLPVRRLRQGPWQRTQCHLAM